MRMLCAPLTQVIRSFPPHVLCGMISLPAPLGPAVIPLVMTSYGGRGGPMPSTILLPQSAQLVKMEQVLP